MAFFTAEKLKRRQITIDPSTVSAESPDVQNRLQRINENYQAFDELFADIEKTIENDDQLREFNSNLRAVDLKPKKKRRWRSRAGQTGAKGKKKTAASASGKRSSGRRGAVSKIKDAQIRLNKPEKKKASPNSSPDTSSNSSPIADSLQKLPKKKPR